MKRLRKAFPKRKIRYFYVGEYGRKCKHGIDLKLVNCPLCFVGRPHFHACIFNYEPDDLEAYQSDGSVMRYTSPKVEELWKYGFVDVGELNFASAAYGARYILKKVTGNKAHDHYMAYDLDGEITFLEPEYCRMSRGNASRKGEKCGIGADWFAKYGTDVFPSDETPVPGHGVVKKVPRYYEEIFKESNPLDLEEIKRVRKRFRIEHGDEYTPERLYAKYAVKKASLEFKARDL